MFVLVGNRTNNADWQTYYPLKWPDKYTVDRLLDNSNAHPLEKKAGCVTTPAELVSQLFVRFLRRANIALLDNVRRKGSKSTGEEIMTCSFKKYGCAKNMKNIL